MSMKRLNRILVLMATCCGGWIGAYAEEPAIQLEHRSCEGECPVYKLMLWRDGTVRYQATSGAPIIGNLQFTVPEHDVEALVNRCDRVLASSEPTTIAMGPLMTGSELNLFYNRYEKPAIELTCFVGQGKKEVSDIGLGPPALSDFETAVESLANPVANLGIMTEWVAKHPDLNTPEGQLALQFAAASNAPAVLALLLDHGARIEATPVMKAAITADCPACISIIQRAGVNVNTPDAEGDLPLVFAAGAGRRFMVQHLLEAGAKLDKQAPLSGAKEGGTMTPLMAAAFCPEAALNKIPDNLSPEQVVLLKKQWAAQERPVRQTCINVVSDLLRSHVDANQANDHGATALMMAVDMGSPETVKLLVQAGANVDARDKQGRSAVERAEGNPEILKLLGK